MKILNIFEAKAEFKPFAAGTAIFEEGQPGDVMYVVKSGEVELWVGKRLMEVVPADGYFGEMAVIEGGKRSAAAIAKSDCVLTPITSKQFEFMVREIPFFAVDVMKVLSRRLRTMDATM